MKQFHWLGLALVPMLVMGCAKSSDPKKAGAGKKSPEASKTADAKAPAPAKNKDNDPPSGDTTKKPPVPEKTPDAGVAVENKVAAAEAEKALRDLFNGLAEKKTVAIWNYLPPSYQKDISGLVSEFAGKMDKDLWTKGFAVARKAVNVLKTQKKILLDMAQPFVADKVDPKKLDENWNAIVGLLETVVNSELADLEVLKKGDVAKLLEGSGAKLVKQILALGALADANQTGGVNIADWPAKLKDIKIIIKKATDKEVTLVVEMPWSPKREEEVYIKVDGKWFPKEAADKWAETMKKAKDSLAKANPDEISKVKPMALQMLDMLDKKLDELGKAKSPEEFTKTISELIQAMSGGGK